MLPNPVSVGLLAFILFIVIDEHCLQAGGKQSKRMFGKHRKREEGTSIRNEAQMDEESESGRSGRHSVLGCCFPLPKALLGKHGNREEGTSSHNEAQTREGSGSGRSGRHSSVHEEHAGLSDPESVEFWKNLDDLDNTGHHFEESVVIVEDDGSVYCLGSLVQLQDGDIKLIIPWTCAENDAEVRIIYNNAPVEVDRRFPPMQFKIPPITLAVFAVLNNVPVIPVRLAKPNMPLDDTVLGVGVNRDGSLMGLSVVAESYCDIKCVQFTLDVTCFCARDAENSEANYGSPFFVKSSGEWYLAGIQEKYTKENKVGHRHILGGNEYTIVNDGVDIEPWYE